MRKILVTAISGDVANGILKCLLDTDDEIYGCDVYDFPVGMDKVVAYWKSDFARDENYIFNLIQQCENYGITHLIPVNEEEIAVISQQRDKFEKKGIKLVINSEPIIDICLDKYQTIKYLSELHSVYVPKTYAYDSFKEDGNEYIIKLKKSCGSKLLERISQKNEIDAFNVEKQELVIQEYLPEATEEYTVGVFSDGIDIYTIAFRRKLNHGYTAFVELVEDKTIVEEAKVIAKSLKLRGYINIQLRKHNKKNYIFEINPRISGTVYFRHMLEFKDVIWWLDMLDGKKISGFELKYKKAIGIRELREKYVILE